MARPRIYRHDLRCPHCGSNWLPTYGRSPGKRTYRCGDGHHHFTPEGNRVFRSEAVKGQAIAMYCAGSSLRAIGRVLEVPLLAVYGWVKKSRAGPAPVVAVAADAGWAAGPGGGPGGDEMRSYVEGRHGGKRKSVRIWTAVWADARGRPRADFAVGGRSVATFPRR